MAHHLILHAGMNKTGSTAIQSALAETGQGADWAFIAPDGPNSSALIRRAFVQGDADALALVSAAFDAADKPRTVLSAENLRQIPPDAFRALVERARARFCSIKGVAYIRAPYAFMTSSYQQRLRTQFVPLHDLIRPHALDYQARFARMEQMLGDGSLHLRPYRLDRFPGGSVVSDFADWQTLGPLREGARGVNQSLTGPGVRLLYIWRRAYPQMREGDAAIVHRLREVPGARLKFAPQVLAETAPLLAAQYDWAQARMGWDMAEDLPDTSDAIRSEADFDVPGPEALDWLASATRSAVARLASPDAIAQAVEALRKPAGLARFNPFKR